jgi:predicted Zn-dependent protease
VIRRFLSALRRLWRRPARLLLIGVLLLCIALGAWVVGAQIWALHHYWAAERALEIFQVTEARRHLDACVRVWPKCARTRLLAARAARTTGDLTAAEKHLQVAELYPGEVSADVIDLEHYLIKAQRGDSEAVLRYCRSLVAEDHPQTPLILEAMAQGYVRMFRLGEAQVCLRVLLDRQPDNPQGLYLRAWVWEQQSNHPEAAADYRHVLKVTGGNEDARLRLASCLFSMSQPADAARHLERLRRRHPKSQLILTRLARCRHELGQQEEAIRLLDLVLAHDPPFPPALVERGQLALQTGDPAGAERLLRQAVAASPIDYKAHFLLHQALAHQGKQEAAREAEKKLTALRSDIDRIRDIIGREMTARPHDPNLHYRLGEVLLRGGDTKESLRWLRSALREDPGHKPTHQLLADYYLKIGSVGRSLRHRKLARGNERALALGPSAGGRPGPGP